MFEDEDPAYGPVSDAMRWVRDEESLHPAVVIPMKLSMAEYAQLTGQEQLDWWSAGGTLKV